MDRLDGVSYPINVMYCTVGWREHVLRYGQRLRTTSVSCSEMRLETMCHHDEFSQGGDVFVAKFQVPRGTNEEDLKQIPQLDVESSRSFVYSCAFEFIGLETKFKPK